MPAQQSSVAATITVVLVDDEHLIRAALSQALRSGGLDVVGEAANGEDAVEMVLETRGHDHAQRVLKTLYDEGYQAQVLR